MNTPDPSESTREQQEPKSPGHVSPWTEDDARATAPRVSSALDDPPRGASLFEVFRNRFIAGLVTIVPIVMTVWAVTVILGLTEQAFGGVIRKPVREFLASVNLPTQLTDTLVVFFSLFVAIITIVAVGYLSRFFLVRRVISLGEAIVTRVPFIKFFYGWPKEVISTLAQKREGTKRVVMVEYPRKGVWVLAYATGEIRMKPENKTLVTVFLPTTPNPTSGFLLLVPADEVRDVNVAVEDAVRLIISAGILAPRKVSTAPFTGLEHAPQLPPPVSLTPPDNTGTFPDSSAR
ncbi:MAG: DUF502 domain-containing protein [Sumerlaeia bacterium]